MKIFQTNGINNFTVPIPKGMYNRFTISVNVAYVPLGLVTQYQIGFVTVKRKGQQLCSGINIGDLLNIRNAEGGALGLVNAVGVALTAQAVLSWTLPNDNNALKFEAGEGELQFIVDPALVLVAGAGSTITVSGVETKTVEKYVPMWNDFTQTLPLVGRITPEINNINVDRVYVRVAGNFTDMQIEKDKNQLVITDSFNLIQNTGYQYRLEALPTFILHDLNYAKNFGEIVSNQVKLYFTAGVGNTGDGTILYQNILFNADRTIKSKASFDKFQQSEVAKSAEASTVKGVLSASGNI